MRCEGDAAGGQCGGRISALLLAKARATMQSPTCHLGCRQRRRASSARARSSCKLLHESRETKSSSTVTEVTKALQAAAAAGGARGAPHRGGPRRGRGVGHDAGHGEALGRGDRGGAPSREPARLRNVEQFRADRPRARAAPREGRPSERSCAVIKMLEQHQAAARESARLAGGAFLQQFDMQFASL